MIYDLPYWFLPSRPPLSLSKAVAAGGLLHGADPGLQRGLQPAQVLRVRHPVGALLPRGRRRRRHQRDPHRERHRDGVQGIHKWNRLLSVCRQRAY